MTTTTTLPKLTWAQFEELEGAIGNFDWLMNQCGLEGIAANADVIHACFVAYDWGFDKELTDTYGERLRDPEFRNDLIALLAERNLTEEHDGQRELNNDTIRQLQAIA